MPYKCMINTYKNGSGDNMITYITNFLGTCCELAIILLFLYEHFKIKHSKKITIILCICFTLFQFANTNIFLLNSYLVILGSIIFIFWVSLLFRIKWFFRFLITLFLYLVNALSEAIVAMILTLVFNIDVAYTQSNALIFAICTLTSKFLAFLFVLISNKKRFTTNNAYSKRNIIWIFLLPIASILIMLLFLRCCYQIADTGFQVITLITSIILAFANIAVFFIIEKQNELIETKEKLLFAEKHINSQIIHYEELYKYQNELRMFRHDIKNRLLSFIGLLKENKVEKALYAMESNLNMIDEMNNNIVNCGNPFIDAILLSKLKTAREKDIDIKISIKLADKINVDEIELGIVLGNALDNAIEAVEKSINNNKTIVFSLILTEDRISIFIQNPVNENIDTDNLRTTKTNKEKHGFGIKSIQAIAQKYNGLAIFTCESKKFSVNINLANHKV